MLIAHGFLQSINFNLIYARKVTYHSHDRRNLSEDIYRDHSEQNNVSELVSDDNQSIINDLPVNEELQEIYERVQAITVANEGQIPEMEDAGVGMVVEALEGGLAGSSEDSVVVSGAVQNSEDRVEEPVRELSTTSDSVSPNCQT